MTVSDYIDNVQEERKSVFLQVLEAVRKGIPSDFEECSSSFTLSKGIPL
jgi:hypothetical protein